MVRQRTTQLSLHKLRDATAFDRLDPTKQKYHLEFEDGVTKLFIQQAKGSPPYWLAYVAPYVSSPKEYISNSSSSFVLFRRVGDRAYAVTGGYGHNAIRGETEENFGLEVALRMIDEETSIASLSQRSMKGVTRQLLRAVAGYDPSLDRENYNRILSALEGKASFEGRRFRVKGKGALVLRTARSVSELDDVITDVEAILARDPRITFPKSYQEVVDPSVVQELDGRLLSALVAYWNGIGTRDDMYLEFSDPMIQYRCDTFEFRFDRRHIALEECDLGRARDALQRAGARVPTTMEDLAKIRVSGNNEFGQAEFADEPFSRLLVFETTLHSGVCCIRLAGRWYRVLDEVQLFLDAELKRLEVRHDLLPAWSQSLFPTELDYNRHAAAHLSGECLDRDLVSLPLRSKVELCDVYVPAKSQFIHVKATWGSKAAYLFSQGLVAGEFYRNSADFRRACATKWPALFTNNIVGGHVVFAIASVHATSSEFPLNLSYFAKVSLYEAASTLRSLGFEVSLASVRRLA